MYGIILEKGHESLPLSELMAVVSLSNAKIAEIRDGFALVSRRFKWERLALAKEVFKIQELGNVRPRGTFAVRIHGSLAESQKVARDIKGKVNLKNPDITYSGIAKNGRLYFGKQVFVRQSFENRKVQNRPFFHPTSLHPKYARVLVNLSRTGPGQTLLDPFCGTGGILIEAALCGLKPVGIDVDGRMVRGSQDNLDFYHLNAEVMHGDARRTKIKCAGIATDPPYGRGSYYSGQGLSQLYLESMHNFVRCLPKGGYVAMIAPAGIPVEEFATQTGFRLREKHYQRVHKSLSRFFYVLQNT